MANHPPITHGLIIKKEHLEKILRGEKTWEVRGRATRRRGPIGLIESGSGLVVGACSLIDVEGPLTLADFRQLGKGRVPADPPSVRTHSRLGT